jgi:hypothetical protein
MNRKLVYLINPVSGTVKKDVVLKMIETKTKQKGPAFRDPTYQRRWKL